MEKDVIHLHGMVLHTTGKTVIEHKASGNEIDAVAKEVAETLLAGGALEVIATVNEELEKNVQ